MWTNLLKQNANSKLWLVVQKIKFFLLLLGMRTSSRTFTSIFCTFSYLISSWTKLFQWRRLELVLVELKRRYKQAALLTVRPTFNIWHAGFTQNVDWGRPFFSITKIQSLSIVREFGRSRDKDHILSDLLNPQLPHDYRQTNHPNQKLQTKHCTSNNIFVFWKTSFSTKYYYFFDFKLRP